jgi:hypothetical protein
MRWRRICVDVAADGQVLNGSIEEYTQIGGTSGPRAIKVISPSFSWERPLDHFRTLLADPWDEPELPFPPQGWVVDGPSPSLDDLRLGRSVTLIDVTPLSGEGEDLPPDTF